MLQKDFVRSVGLSVSFYGHFERGTRVPSVPTLALIANRLGVGCDALLRDSLEHPCLPPRNLPESRWNALRELLETQDISLDEWFAEEESAPAETQADDGK